MKFFRNVIFAVIFLTLIVAGFMVKTFYDAGEFRELNPHFNGRFISVTGVLSSEDINIPRIDGSSGPGAVTRAREPFTDST
jgi:hypothetical protein